MSKTTLDLKVLQSNKTPFSRGITRWEKTRHCAPQEKILILSHPSVLLTKNTDSNFSADLLHFYFAYSLLPPFMLHICSGYLGCGLHYGRNGSPQNPFSRKGLYPWTACSGVWHFLWNKHSTKASFQTFFLSTNVLHGDHILWATMEILFLGFAMTCKHSRALPTDTQTHTLLSPHSP